MKSNKFGARNVDEKTKKRTWRLGGGGWELCFGVQTRHSIGYNKHYERLIQDMMESWPQLKESGRI